MNIDRAKAELMQIYGFLSPDKQMAIDTAVKVMKSVEDIKQEIDSYCSDNRDRNDGLYIAMKIIDKHTKGDEQ